MSEFNFITIQDWIDTQDGINDSQSQFQSILFPFDDESTGSYLTRLAHENCANPILILHRLLNSNRSLNTAFKSWDIDKLSTSDTFHLWLQKYSENDPIILKFYKDNAYNYVQGGGKWKASSNPLKSYKFCKYCLESDAKPYFRYKWKLNFVWICEIHQIPLESACLSCGTPPDFWKLNWDQSIDICYNCYNRIQDGDGEQDHISTVNQTIKIQNELLEALSSKSSSIRQFWKFVWGQLYNKKTRKFPELTIDLLGIPDTKILGLLENVGLKTILKTPYICQKHNAHYQLFNAYYLHLLMHQDIKCKIQGCGSNSFRLHKNNLQCISCRSLYSIHGSLIEAENKIPNNCLNKLCKSKSITRKSDGYFLCVRCGAEFSSRRIIKKGINPLTSCPLCGKNNFKVYKDDMKCQSCFTILNEFGKMESKGILPPSSCVNNCPSKAFTRTNKYFTCRKCKSRFSLNHQTLKIHKLNRENLSTSNKTVFLCLNEECQRTSFNQLKNGKSCKKCNSKLYEDGSIVVNRIPKECPLEKCRSKKIARFGSRYNQEFICRRCGSRISDEGDLIHERSFLQVCTFCFSKQLDVENSGLISCKTCHAKIDQNHQLISEGIKHPEVCLNPNCSGKNFYFSKGNSRCKTCGSIFNNKKIITQTEIGPKTCSFCKRCNIQRKSLNEAIFACRICGSVLDVSGKIITKGVLPPSSCQYCGSVQIRRSRNRFRCKKCSKIQES